MKKFSLLCMLLILVFTIGFFNLNIYAAGPEQMKGVWLWGSTVREMGKDGVVSVIEDLKNYGFTDIFLLVKGESGVVGYPSKVALSVANNPGDMLKDIITEAHKNKIKVHAWYVINGDAAWSTKNPDDRMVHLKNGPVNGKISPLAPGYQKYIKGLIQEVIENYDIDGVHLDYIRYTHAVYSFDKYTLEEAEKRKIDIEQVRNILNQSFYAPKDGSIVIKVYQNGDPAIVGWEKLRKDIIGNFARDIGKIVKAAKRPLFFSAALMPEGAYDPVFADVYYGQNYKDAGSIYDFVVPMAYWKDFSKPPRWVGTVVVKQAAVSLGKASVYAGLQAYEFSGNKELADAEEAAKANGSNGVVLFRYGTFAFASVQVKNGSDGKDSVSFELKNRGEYFIDAIEVDFKGTGLVPKAVLETPEGKTSQVNNNIVSMEGEQLLGHGKTLNFSVEVEKDSTMKASSPMPLIKLSLRKRLFVPVYAVMKF